MISSTDTSTNLVSTHPYTFTNSLLLRMSDRALWILFIVCFVLASVLVMGSCAALISSKNLLFLLLSTVGGVVLSMGIILHHAFQSKKNCQQIF